MVSITHSVVISRPQADVFEYVSNYENDPVWRSGVLEMVQTPGGPAQIGTTTREVLRVFDRDEVTSAEVTSLEPGRRIEFQSTAGPVPVSGYREVEDGAAGAVFTYHLAMELSGDLSEFAPVVQQEFGARIDGDLDRLKSILEAS